MSCNTKEHEQTVTFEVCAEANACRDMDDVLMVPAENLAFGSHVFQHSFQVFVAQKSALFENPCFHSKLQAYVLFF
jgi:hypothetical protein